MHPHVIYALTFHDFPQKILIIFSTFQNLFFKPLLENIVSTFQNFFRFVLTFQNIFFKTLNLKKRDIHYLLWQYMIMVIGF